jgi:hypothetical protein
MVTGRGVGVHVDEVAYRLRLLEMLGRHAVAYRNGDYLAPVWQEAYAKSGLQRLPQTDKEAWEEFTYHANQALQVFRALANTSRSGTCQRQEGSPCLVDGAGVRGEGRPSSGQCCSRGKPATRPAGRETLS